MMAAIRQPEIIKIGGTSMKEIIEAILDHLNEMTRQEKEKVLAYILLLERLR